MAADAPGQPKPPPADSVARGWSHDRAGSLVFTGKSGIPDSPLSAALRSTACSSLVGFLIGLVIVPAAVTFGWDEASAAALTTYGMPQIRRGYRLRAVLAFTVTTAACLVAGILLLGDWLPEPWDFFLPLAFALTVGSLAGTAAAYLGRQTIEQRG